MRRPRMRGILILAVAALALGADAAGAVKTATPFADNMVLQRGMAVPVWGTADAGERVTVSFAGQTKSTTADAAGKWFVTLDPMTESAESRTLDREFEYIIAANPNALIMPRVCADAPGLIV